MDVQLAAQAVGELVHLAPVGIGLGVAICGVTGIKVAKKFFWIGQVSCADCRREHARNRGCVPERRKR